jgi:hypothetical protein
MLAPSSPKRTLNPARSKRATTPLARLKNLFPSVSSPAFLRFSGSFGHVISGRGVRGSAEARYRQNISCAVADGRTRRCQGAVAPGSSAAS